MEKIHNQKTADSFSNFTALDKQLQNLNKILRASADIEDLLDAELRIRNGADREEVLEDLWGEREWMGAEEFIQFNLERTAGEVPLPAN